MSGTYAIPSETEEDAAEAIDALEEETRKPH
jgi:hypothetical protein